VTRHWLKDARKWLTHELRGFYVVVSLGTVVFSLLTYLPAEKWMNDVTFQGIIWGMCAYLCFVLLAFTYLLETVYDEIVKRRKR